jgi:hypothetical protein
VLGFTPAQALATDAGSAAAAIEQRLQESRTI